jgi:hypothetical protein
MESKTFMKLFLVHKLDEAAHPPFLLSLFPHVLERKRSG